MKKAFSLLVFLLSALAFGLFPALASAVIETPPPVQEIAWNIAKGVFDGVLSSISPTITAVAVAWIVDKVLFVVPFLRPFRDMVIQFVHAKLEELRRTRAQAFVLEAGQKYAKAEITKAERHSYAQAGLEIAGIASPFDAGNIVHGAVADLKAKGINP
jgi:hypothetical protein